MRSILRREYGALRIPLLALVVVLLLGGGAVAYFLLSPPEDEPPPAEPGVRAIVAQPVDILGWDPHDHGCTMTEAVLVNVFDYLVWRTPGGQLEPSLALEWEKLDDVTWEFRLRPDVYWHDGEPFGADDVVFSLERLAALGTEGVTARYPYFRRIESVTAVDELSVHIRTVHPDSTLPSRLSRTGAAILPHHYFNETDVAAEMESLSREDFWQSPVGTGPFRIVAHIPDDRIRLQSFPEHWRGPAAVRDLTFLVVPDPSQRAHLLLEGEVDVATHIGSSDWVSLESSEGVRLVRRIGSQAVVLTLSMEEHHPTHRTEIREAIDLALDNQSLVDDVFAGAATSTRTRVIPGAMGSHPDLYNSYRFDPERARQLIVEHTSEEQRQVGLLYSEDAHPAFPDLAEAMAEMLENVGLRVVVDAKPHSEYFSILGTNSAPALSLSVEDGCAADCSVSFEHLVNDDLYRHPGGFECPEFEEIFLRASASGDRNTRVREYRLLAEMVAEARPEIPLFHLLSNHGVGRGIDWSPRPDELLWMWPAVRTPTFE